MKLNRETYAKKVYGCWVGKNIGGTMGTPYEGKRQVQNIQGFVTKPNEILPNDDLDLQLVWLHAVEQIGPYGLDCKKLGEFWCSFIVPFWNEYGLGKNNMIRGLQAPLSGDYKNPWKNSNGAWIRTEIWASMAPGAPAVAAKYAIEDAKVDHGAGEGTIAAAFVAAMQSAAFVVSDVRRCIEIALTQIPAESRMAKSVVKLFECYDKGMSAPDARNVILELNSDIGDGWFEAPSNVTYAILGLLWGQGDFKKSMILAINCGDDTDCTGATVGSTLGIIGGVDAIPEDWRSYIGDDIITISLNRSTQSIVPPNTCKELTERVIRQAPVMLIANHADVEFTDGADEIPENVEKLFTEDKTTLYSLEHLLPNSFTEDAGYAAVTAIYEREPDIAPGESLKVTLRFTNNVNVYGNAPTYFSVRWLTPEGFTVSGKNSIRLAHFDAHDPAVWEEEYVITAGECVAPVNRIVAEVVCMNRPTPIYVSLVVLG